MKINWKSFATSSGYKSLKTAYIHDVKKASEAHSPMRDKQEFLRKFRWVIDRAKHYAQRLNKPIEEVLNEWESKRNYWWINYYQECSQPKILSNKAHNVKPMGAITYAKLHLNKNNRAVFNHRKWQQARYMREHVHRKKLRYTKGQLVAHKARLIRNKSL